MSGSGLLRQPYMRLKVSRQERPAPSPDAVAEAGHDRLVAFRLRCQPVMRMNIRGEVLEALRNVSNLFSKLRVCSDYPPRRVSVQPRRRRFGYSEREFA